MRSGIVGLAVLGVALVPAPAGAATGVACGSVVEGSVVLDRDLECTGPGLVVGPAGADIDLGGHTIRYVGPPLSEPDSFQVVGVRATDGLPVGVGVRVSHGRVEGYPVMASGSGVRLEVEGVCTDGRVSATGVGLEVRHSRIRGAGATLADVVLEDNVITGSVGVGEVSAVRVVGNVIRPHGQVGVSLAAEVGAAQVRDNDIRGASTAVEVGFASSAEVVRNTLRDNGLGVVLSGAVSDVAVVDNRITRTASAGISSTGFAQGTVTISGNRVHRSGWRATAEPGTEPLRDGISVRADPQFAVRHVLTGNRVTRSAGHGIDAAGVTDGGGNRARGSGRSPDCIGVAC